MENKILGFFAESRWASNFHEHPEIMIYIDGYAGQKIACCTVEAAYQASKTFDIEQCLQIANAETPDKAKKMGRSISLRSDWESVKINIMLELLIQKFSHPYYRDLLKSTGDAYLEETNSWSDFYWGIWYGVGQNHLGKLLMQIHETIQ